MLQIIKASDDRDAMREIIEQNPRFREIESEAVSAINVFTGMRIPVKQKERKMDMCKAYEEQRRYDMAQGKAEGKAEDTIELLEEVGELSPVLRKLIMGQTELEVLRRWHKLAARAESIEDFEEKAGILERI